MYKKLLAAVVVYATILTPGWAETPSGAPPLNQTMTRIGQVMVEFFPVIVSTHRLDAHDRAHISKNLSILLDLFRIASPQIKQRPETYNVSYQLVLEQLERIKRDVDRNNFERARMQLHSLGTICTSCHTQDTTLRTLFSGVDRVRFADDLSFAEFNYFTRNYAEAERYYDKYLHSDTAKSALDIVNPLQHLITIYAQILNDPGTGAQKLSAYTDIRGHSAITKKRLTGWIAGLRRLDTRGASKINHPDLNALEGYIREYIGPLEEPFPITHVAPEDEVARVWLRGQLYHYLNTKPNASEIPKLLYWLAVADRAIGYDFNFSLADLYLKDCVMNYTDDPYAPRCYNEYKEYVTFVYSGSAGTFIPPEIEAELDQMHKTLNAGRYPARR